MPPIGMRPSSCVPRVAQGFVGGEHMSVMRGSAAAGDLLRNVLRKAAEPALHQVAM
jgi:hypothetical protein